MECLLKHVEAIVVQHRLRIIREKIEPQVLSLAPEGIQATIKILRSYARKADCEECDEMKSDDDYADRYVDVPRSDDELSDSEGMHMPARINASRQAKGAGPT